MKYYRRYMGAYLTKTMGLSMAEDGAYGRLLDWYYANEKPLPAEPDRVFAIARTRCAADKNAVKNVLKLHFTLEADGYHNSAADAELEIATEKIENIRKAAIENGKKGGRPKRSTTKPVTESGSENKPNAVPENNPSGNHPLTFNQDPKPKTETTPAIVDRTTAPESAAAGAVDLESLRIGLPAGSVEGDKAAELWACLHANGCKGTASHPSVIEMSRQGVTIDLLKRAIAEARKTREGPLNPAYLAAIIDRLKTERPAKHGAWMTSDHDCELKAAELGIKARPLETYGELRARIRAELEKRADASVR